MRTDRRAKRDTRAGKLRDLPAKKLSRQTASTVKGGSIEQDNVYKRRGSR